MIDGFILKKVGIVGSFTLKAAELESKWHIIDAENMVVGRLAAAIVPILRGKHKPTYTPHMNCGDHIIVINADKVKFTGDKYKAQIYYRHTGYPGGLKERTAKDVLTGKYPERVIQKAVERMLPRGVLGREQFSRLKVYCGTEHPHGAQQPQILDLAAQNSKNKR